MGLVTSQFRQGVPERCRRRRRRGSGLKRSVAPRKAMGSADAASTATGAESSRGGDRRHVDRSRRLTLRRRENLGTRLPTHRPLFWWAAERGLASEEHELEEVRSDPTAHFISGCDTKLLDQDLTARGNSFAAQEYGAYLDEAGAYAKSLGVGDNEIAEGDATTKHFFTWLEARLAYLFPSEDRAERGSR